MRLKRDAKKCVSRACDDIFVTASHLQVKSCYGGIGRPLGERSLGFRSARIIFRIALLRHRSFPI